MRHAIRQVPEEIPESHGRGDAFVVGAVALAAVMVAIFALHGGPNLLGDRFDASAITTQPR